MLMFTRSACVIYVNIIAIIAIFCISRGSVATHLKCGGKMT